MDLKFILCWLISCALVAVSSGNILESTFPPDNVGEEDFESQEVIFDSRVDDLPASESDTIASQHKSKTMNKEQEPEKSGDMDEDKPASDSKKNRVKKPKKSGDKDEDKPASDSKKNRVKKPKKSADKDEDKPASDSKKNRVKKPKKSAVKDEDKPASDSKKNRVKKPKKSADKDEDKPAGDSKKNRVKKPKKSGDKDEDKPASDSKKNRVKKPKKSGDKDEDKPASDSKKNRVRKPKQSTDKDEDKPASDSKKNRVKKPKKSGDKDEDKLASDSKKNKVKKPKKSEDKDANKPASDSKKNWVKKPKKSGDKDEDKPASDSKKNKVKKPKKSADKAEDKPTSDSKKNRVNKPKKSGDTDEVKPASHPRNDSVEKPMESEENAQNKDRRMLRAAGKLGHYRGTTQDGWITGCEEAEARGPVALGQSTGQVETVFSQYAKPMINVYCDVTTLGGGWTVFQRRVDGTLDFATRGYAAYQYGFGDLDGEHWLGLENMADIMGDDEYQLRLEMRDVRGKRMIANYGEFSLGKSTKGYRLKVGSFDGIGVGNVLASSNGKKFSTFDRDNSGLYCGTEFGSGFWFGGCSHSSPNGKYIVDTENPDTLPGINWSPIPGRFGPLTQIEMKFRKKSFSVVKLY